MSRIFIRVGPITIYWYSVTMLLAILTGIFVTVQESKKLHLEEYIESLLISVIGCGIIGARLYYVIFNIEAYRNNFLSIFKIWEGGLAIYGAFLGGLLAVIYQARRRRQKILQTTDMIVPGLLLAQSIGRWGNFFNQEAHGAEVTLEFLKKMSLPNFIINGMNIQGVYYEPTFLYESLWCFVGFIILIIIRHISKRKMGIMTWSYFIWYGLGRIYIESLRTDSLFLGTIRISQLVSLILILVGGVGMVVTLRKRKINQNKRKKVKDEEV